MSLPAELKAAIEQILSSTPRAQLASAASELSQRYRSQERDKQPAFMTTDAHRLAYLAVRMPATYSVVRRVLLETKLRMPEFSPITCCDMGAGPGTATWAAVEVFPELAQVALHEKDIHLSEVGKKLMGHASSTVLRRAVWQQSDLLQPVESEPSELMVISYVIGELPIDAVEQMINRAWIAASKVLVVIEPGTPHGFERIRKVREILIAKGAYLVAPCPHARECPMANGDWCHFAERLERSLLHMSVKEVIMGYEDEKFAYIVASKQPVALPEARVLRHPQKHSGHVELMLCSQDGLKKQTVSRRHGEQYKHARKIEWGDVWP